jgi:hypothetical protein
MELQCVQQVAQAMTHVWFQYKVSTGKQLRCMAGAANIQVPLHKSDPAGRRAGRHCHI